jgi:hypothetical protein
MTAMKIRKNLLRLLVIIALAPLGSSAVAKDSDLMPAFMTGNELWEYCKVGAEQCGANVIGFWDGVFLMDHSYANCFRAGRESR